MKIPNWLIELILVLAGIAIVACVILFLIIDDAPTLSQPIPARYIDNEAGVVCYSRYGGIDCLPIGETRLDAPRMQERGWIE